MSSLDPFDKQGESIDNDEYLRLSADFEYRVVAQTKLYNGVYVSTIWLGLPHGFRGDRPLIFETLVTYEDSDEEEIYRYTTESEALAHHNQLCGGDSITKSDHISRWKQISLDID